VFDFGSILKIDILTSWKAFEQNVERERQTWQEGDGEARKLIRKHGRGGSSSQGRSQDLEEGKHGRWGRGKMGKAGRGSKWQKRRRFLKLDHKSISGSALDLEIAQMLCRLWLDSGLNAGL